jgi:hypothetical protein
MAGNAVLFRELIFTSFDGDRYDMSMPASTLVVISGAGVSDNGFLVFPAVACDWFRLEKAVGSDDMSGHSTVGSGEMRLYPLNGGNIPG